MEMKEEMINDTMDDMMEEENDEQESEEIINQVLDEIGINLSSQVRPRQCSGLVRVSRCQLADTPMVPAPAAAPPAAAKVAQPADVDMELQARLDNLRKNTKS
jgi:charged multivesicular body protein 2A